MSPLPGSRTTKTIALLVAAMTVGAGALILLETDPVPPTVDLPLSAIREHSRSPEFALVRQTDGVPIQFIKWRNVVVHDHGRDGAGVADGCHFIIGSASQFGDGIIRATSRWRRQGNGRHMRCAVGGHNYNANSIGICLLADCRRGRPTAGQMDALIKLVRALQLACNIGPDHVYLHSDLAEPGCPGRHFPAQAFRDGLLTARR